jgi:hypothetical protein
MAKKKTETKKSTAKKPAVKKTTATKSTAKKTAAKKPTTNKATAKPKAKPVVKKTAKKTAVKTAVKTKSKPVTKPVEAKTEAKINSAITDEKLDAFRRSALGSKWSLNDLTEKAYQKFGHENVRIERLNQQVAFFIDGKRIPSVGYFTIN